MKGKRASIYNVVHNPAHEASSDFPTTMEGLNKTNVIIFSDIETNTLLLHPDVWLRVDRVINRIKLHAEWAKKGGGLIMIRGYLPFEDIDGRVRWYKTEIEVPFQLPAFPPITELIFLKVARLSSKQKCIPFLTEIGREWPYLSRVNEVIVNQTEGTVLVLSLPEDQGGLP